MNPAVARELTVVIHRDVQRLVAVANVMPQIRSRQESPVPVPSRKPCNQRIIAPDRRPGENTVLEDRRGPVERNDRIVTPGERLVIGIVVKVDVVLRPLRRIRPLPVVGIGSMLSECRAILDEQEHLSGKVIDRLRVDEAVTYTSPGGRKKNDEDDKEGKGGENLNEPLTGYGGMVVHRAAFLQYRKSAGDNQSPAVASRRAVQYLESMDMPLSKESVRAAFAAAARGSITLEGFRRAGVLVPLVFTPSGVELLFTKRTEQVETHKGQISFPGGMVDEGDRDITATAIREANEEIGIHNDDLEVVGLLSDIATPSGFIITPVVAFLRPEVAFTLNWAEVAEVFHVPLTFFAGAGRARQEFRVVQGEQREVWHYDTGRHIIWGATAAIVRSLLAALHMI